MKIFEKIKIINNYILNNIFFIIILIIFLIFYLSGIKNKTEQLENGSGGTNNYNDNFRATKAPVLLRANNINKRSDSKVVKNFSITIETEDIQGIKDTIENKISRDSAIIESFYSYTYFENELAYNFTIMVPTDKINLVISYFKTLGNVKNESSSAIDVTDEYQDTKNRLQNLYLRRDNLRKLMNEKANKIGDILAIDKELSDVQYNIERLESLNNKMDNDIKYSKLELNIIPKITIIGFNNSKWQVSKSWENAINKFIMFSQKTVDFVFEIFAFSPFVLLIAIIIILIKIISIRKKRKIF